MEPVKTTRRQIRSLAQPVGPRDATDPAETQLGPRPVPVTPRRAAGHPAGPVPGVCCGAVRDIRAVLHRELRAWHPGGDTLFVDELDLGGVVRVDTAAINSALWGYEIKSARDTLRRPPQQVEVYSKVCDHAALLVAENHREHAAELLPSWWAMYVVTGGPEVLELTPVATGGPNPGVDPLATAQLL